MTAPAPYLLLDVASRAADAGAEVLRHWFRHRDLDIREKSAHDFVTRADRESEEAILGIILDAFPDHGVLAEESGERIGGDDDAPVWIVDPLDGTSNFLQGLPVFCISIACRHGDRTLAGLVLDPLRGDRFTATADGGAFHDGRSMRVSQRPGLHGAFLATG
ncbi:MAG: inositol monophosphatase family protein, partial [Acidobacteriota bacterium]